MNIPIIVVSSIALILGLFIAISAIAIKPQKHQAIVDVGRGDIVRPAFIYDYEEKLMPKLKISKGFKITNSKWFEDLGDGMFAAYSQKGFRLCPFVLTDSHYTLDDVAYCAGTQVWSEDDLSKPKHKKFKRACRDEKGRILVRIDKEV